MEVREEVCEAHKDAAKALFDLAANDSSLTKEALVGMRESCMMRADVALGKKKAKDDTKGNNDKPKKEPETKKPKKEPETKKPKMEPDADEDVANFFGAEDKKQLSDDADDDKDLEAMLEGEF